MTIEQIIALIIGTPFCLLLAHLAILDHEIRYCKIVNKREKPD